MRILVVEDEKNLNRLIAEGIEDEGYSVDRCFNGKEALDYISSAEYDAIVMDPPSYGRGPTGEMWKIEKNLYPLVEACVKLLSDRPCFFLLNSYTTGLAPAAMQSLLTVALKGKNASVEADEVGLPIQQRHIVLPCGATARATFA